MAKKLSYTEVNRQLESGALKTKALLDQVYIANQGLIVDVIKKITEDYALSEDEKDDLRSAGQLALYNAAETYDFKNQKGAGFSTWAQRIIKQGVGKELNRIKKQKKNEYSNNKKDKDLEFEDPNSDLEKDFLAKEEREEKAHKIEKLIREKTKGIKPKELDAKINIYLEYCGYKDGIAKTVDDLSGFFGRKRSRIISIIRSCERILREDAELKENVKGRMAGETIKEKDLVLLQYIIKCNKEDIYPNATLITAARETSPLFKSKYSIGDSIRRLKDVKGCRFELVGRGQGYKLLNEEAITSLTDEDLMAASIISLLLKEYSNTPFKKSFRAIWGKLREGQGVVAGDTPFQEEPVSLVTDPLPFIDMKIFKKLYEATRSRRSITFEYNSASSGDLGERKADPYHIVCQKGSWYVLCYCPESEIYKWFSFSRFKKVNISKKVYEVKEDFNLKDYFSEKAGILWGKEAMKVKLRVRPHMAVYMSERKWYADQTETLNDDGTLDLEFTTNHPSELQRFIMHWSPDVEVIEPEELRKTIREVARKTAALY